MPRRVGQRIENIFAENIVLGRRFQLTSQVAVDIVPEAPHDTVRGSPEKEPRGGRPIRFVHTE